MRERRRTHYSFWGYWLSTLQKEKKKKKRKWVSVTFEEEKMEKEVAAYIMATHTRSFSLSREYYLLKKLIKNFKKRKLIWHDSPINQQLTEKTKVQKNKNKNSRKNKNFLLHHFSFFFLHFPAACCSYYTRWRRRWLICSSQRMLATCRTFLLTSNMKNWLICAYQLSSFC